MLEIPSNTTKFESDLSGVSKGEYLGNDVKQIERE